ncbi:MAG: PEPxxWA-CTERM sorting domain-containing protein [Phenylobacterium sp.]|nr:PEPxxWA-CTERM sorting domain-containing protein [Phenylobacterium sp.]
MKTFVLAAAAALALSAAPAQAAVTFKFARIGIMAMAEIYDPVDGNLYINHFEQEVYEERETFGDIFVADPASLSLSSGGLLGEVEADFAGSVTFTDPGNGVLQAGGAVEIDVYHPDVTAQATYYYGTAVGFEVDRAFTLTLDATNLGRTTLSLAGGGIIWTDPFTGTGSQTFSLGAGYYAINLQGYSDLARQIGVGSISTEFENSLNFSIVETGVPEPTTWAMMIAGFGLAGTTLRRRRPAGADRAAT